MIIAAPVLRTLRPNTRITAPPVPREDNRDPKWHDFKPGFLSLCDRHRLAVKTVRAVTTCGEWR